MVVQRSGLFGEPDLTDRYVGWIGLTFGLAGLVCAIRQYFAYVIEIGRTEVLLRPPEMGELLRVQSSTVTSLVLSKGDRAQIYQLSLERQNDEAITVEFRSKEPLEDIAAVISLVYPGLELQP